MAWWQHLTGRRRREQDEDLQKEIRSHLTMAARDRVDDGLPPEAARRAALREFGNVTLTREAARRTWSARWVDEGADFLREIRYAVRLLGRSPGFALVVVAVLAFGIGANAFVFTLAKAIFLKPLPGVERPASLGVVVSRTNEGRVGGLSYAAYQNLRDHDGAFSGLAASMMSPFSLGLGARGERVWGELVTGNYFELLGVRARIGRTLLPSDEAAPGRHPVVVLSDDLWRRAFGSDPDIVGKTIRLNAYPMTVVGVTPPGFQGTVVSLAMELFVPVMMQPQLLPPDRLSDRSLAGELMVFGRPKPGTSMPAAAAQTAALSAPLSSADSIDEASRRADVIPLWRSPFGAQTYMLPVVSVLVVMGSLLLLIVCANVANLVLVRGISRRGEIAARLALGASRGRILRLLFIENLVLAVPGAIGGVLLTRVFRTAMAVSGVEGSAPMRVGLDLSIDALVVGFAVLLGCASTILFGFIPALHGSRVDLASIIKDDATPRTAPRGHLRSALVVAQVAVSLILLVGTALVLRSLDASRNADVGFDDRHVVTVSLDVKPSGYDEDRGRIFYQQLLDTMRADARVDSASLTLALPLSLVDGPSRDFSVEGYTARRDEDLGFLFNIVGPDYFRTLRIGVVAGREFDRRDDAPAPGVAIVSEAMARRFWTSASNAIGKRLRAAGGEWRTVVGVAGDVKYARLTEEPRPHVYLPFLQAYTPGMTLQVRGNAATPNFVQHVADRVRSLDSNLPILRADTLRNQGTAGRSLYGYAAGALAVFGITATGLAALGIYGLMAYSVRQSTHEIGIRMAIGAQRRDVVKRFLTQGVRLGAIGAVLGLIVAAAASRLLANALYGVNAADPISFASASALVLTVALVASLIPAWRAAQTDPIAALRHR